MALMTKTRTRTKTAIDMPRRACMCMAMLLLCALLLAVAASAETERVLVDFNAALLELAAKSPASGGITFVDAPTELVPQSLLPTQDGAAASVPCIAPSVIANASATATVLLVLSDCLPPTAIDLAARWIRGLKTDRMLVMLQDATLHAISIATTVVPGDCTTAASRDASTTSMHRVTAAFAGFGRVLAALSVASDDPPIAIFSVLDNAISLQRVQQFAVDHKVAAPFHFVMCDPAIRNCANDMASAGGYLHLDRPQDLLWINPFVLDSKRSCASLQGAVASLQSASNDDPQQHQQCRCTCAAGFEPVPIGPDDQLGCRQVVANVQSCSWSKERLGYKYRSQLPVAHCNFDRIAATWKMPVPIPIDNSIKEDQHLRDDPAHSRDATAVMETLEIAAGPHIELESRQLSAPIYDFQTMTRLLAVGGGGSEESLPSKLDDLLDQIGMGDQVATAAFIQPEEPEDDLSESSHRFAWHEFQADRVRKVDTLSFSSYGKYALALTATNMEDSAACHGCIALVDHFRPRATTQCPTPISDIPDNLRSIAALDKTNQTTASPHSDGYVIGFQDHSIQRVEQIVKQVYEFQERAMNDACSTEGRCDMESFRIKDFTMEEYQTKPWDEGRMCFSIAHMERELIALLRTRGNPLVETNNALDQVNQAAEPVAIGACTRCCSYEVQLREFWTDFTCGFDYDLRRCSGLESERCAVSQCLVVSGDTLVAAFAQLKADVVAASEQAIATIDGKTDVQRNLHTEIHRILPCAADSTSECSFATRISDLIEIQVRANLRVVVTDPQTLVFWRYRLDRLEADPTTKADWHIFDPTANDQVEHALSAAITHITLEAWTQCGPVRRFQFHVYLHAPHAVGMCDSFPAMWSYRQPSSPSDPTSPTAQMQRAVCLHVASDFVDLQFDFDAKRDADAEDANGRISHADPLELVPAARPTRVACEFQFADRAAIALFSFEVSNAQPRHMERLAVQVSETNSSAMRTAFAVRCAFTFSNQAKQSCELDLLAIPCDEHQQADHLDQDAATTATQSEETALCRTECTTPRIYQACGGKVVKPTSTRDTMLHTTEQLCCQSCAAAPLICTALPGPTDQPQLPLKQCRPAAPPPFVVVVRDHLPLGRSLSHLAVAITALGMLALLLLVVVARMRRRQADRLVDGSVAWAASERLIQ